MQVTTKDIIKMMPFEEAFKADLLEKFDSLEGDQRYTVERTLWDLYDAIYTLKLQGKIDAALAPDAGMPLALNKDFYQKVRDEVEKEMSTDTTKAVEEVDLQAARDKLQDLIKQEE